MIEISRNESGEVKGPVILDSGERRQFDSGAVRDIAEGKGRCDLLPLDIIGYYLCQCAPADDIDRYKLVGGILGHLNAFIRKGNINCIYASLSYFIDNTYNSLVSALIEVSKHYEEGAKKYAERNWEKGIPCHCYIDSGVRHLLKWLDDWHDEPHDRAFVWNMLGLLWTVENHPDYNDLPHVQIVQVRDSADE